MSKLVCDRCGATYTDRESIEEVLKLKASWAELCKRPVVVAGEWVCDGIEPRGLAPCPIMRCEGELILINDECAYVGCPLCGSTVPRAEIEKYGYCEVCQLHKPRPIGRG